MRRNPHRGPRSARALALSLAALLPLSSAGCRGLPLDARPIRTSSFEADAPISDGVAPEATASDVPAPVTLPTPAPTAAAATPVPRAMPTPLLDAALAQAIADRAMLHESPAPDAVPVRPIESAKTPRIRVEVTASLPDLRPVPPDEPRPPIEEAAPETPDETTGEDAATRASGDLRIESIDADPTRTPDIPAPVARPGSIEDPAVTRAAAPGPGEPKAIGQAESEPAPLASTEIPAGALEIAQLALCRKVRGFGEFDRLADVAIRQGAPAILYCEMVGVGYEEGPDGFRSCLHSRAELSRERTGEVVWSQDFEPAEDLSPRPRRDYFASYRLRLPEGLEPGQYRLTLEQTDALTGLSGRKAIDLVVRP